jgi:hypothetical protein
MGDQGQTRTIFRGCDRRRAQSYVTSGKSESITTAAPGDFHLKEPAAYFTYNRKYAQHFTDRRGARGSVIKQVISLNMLKKAGDYYNFGAVPDDSWRQLITACRRQEKATGSLLNIQKRMVVEGSTADTSTEVFKMLPVSNDKFKPAIVDGEYALQIVFKRTALEQLASLGREILPK